MPEKLEELPDFQNVYDQYKGRRFEDAKIDNVRHEKLALQDRDSIQLKLDDFASGFGDKFAKIGKDSPYESKIYESDEYWRKNVKIGEQIVDSSVPLRIVAYKEFVNEKGEETERLRFCFDKNDEDQPVGVVSLAFAGHEGFEVHHRYVEPQYRKGNGIGTILLKCADSFAKSYATDKQEKICLFAGVGQLDVIYWFWKNGYRPEEGKDWEKLDMILNGEKDLCLDDGLYVFDKKLPVDDRYRKEDDGQIIEHEGKKVINHKNSFRLNMVKYFEPGMSADAGDISMEVKKRVGGNLWSQ